MFFSQKYEAILNDESFIQELDNDTKLALFYLLDEWNLATICYPYKDNPTWNENTMIGIEVIIKYHKQIALSENEYGKFEKDWFLSKLTYEIFDIIEIWFTELTLQDAYNFSNDINDFFTTRNLPWRIASGVILKIDLTQFEQDMAHVALTKLDKIKNIDPAFRSAYSEYLEAIEKFEQKDYKYAILNANHSYESVLKIILNEPEGTALQLIKKYKTSPYINNLPSFIKKDAFCEKMLSLPYLRNRPSIGHGGGTITDEIPPNLAKLAINLAASLNTYLIEEYAKHLNIDLEQQVQVEIEQKDNSGFIDFENVPF